MGLVAEIDDRVSIVSILSEIGVYVPDGIYDRPSMKLHCPFEHTEHSDFGKDPAFRVYIEENTAYCFSCKRFYTPSRLQAQLLDISIYDAAVFLAEKHKFAPAEIDSDLHPMSDSSIVVDTSSLAKALQIFCSSISTNWGTKQFEPAIASTLYRCMQLLKHVGSKEDAEDWLKGCKAAMRRVLE